MTDKATIFADDKSAAAPVTTTTVIDPNNPVALLVGDNRKYKTVEELAKAYVHIDGFAEQLKSENSELRQKLAEAKTLDDVLEQLKPPATKKDDTPLAPVKTLGVDEVAAIVRQTMTGLETARTREDNLRKADVLMKQAFGDKAAEVFSQVATTPDKRDVYTSLAAVDPEKFVALFVKPQGTTTSLDTKTSTNTTSLSFSDVSARVNDPTAREYYDALRKKDPRAYYSQGTQLAMQRAVLANREHFYGRKSS